MLNTQTKNAVKVRLLQDHNGLPLYAAVEALAKKFANGEVTLTDAEIQACMNGSTVTTTGASNSR